MAVKNVWDICMKTLTIVLAAVLCLAGAMSASGATAANLPGDYTTYAVCIRIGDRPGSGVVLDISNSVCLATARHVLFDDSGAVTNWHLWNTQAVVSGYAAVGDKEPGPFRMELAVQEINNRSGVRFSTNHDVALVRCGEFYGTNHSTAYWNADLVRFTTANSLLSCTPAQVIKRFKDLAVSADVITFGFPSSIGLEEMPQIDPSVPLLRKGIIAGINRSKGTIILDAPVYGGDSGGPVLLRETEGTRYVLYLVGIQTQFIPFREVWQNLRYKYLNQDWMNSGYSVAEPMDAIVDMVWK